MAKKTHRETPEGRGFDLIDHGGGGAARRETASEPEYERKPETEEKRIGISKHGTEAFIQGDHTEASGMALSVTRHASPPGAEKFTFLLCGIDTLDLGLYVSWGPDWKRRLHALDKKKQEAGKNGGLLLALPSGRKAIFKPGGKGQNYRFHLQFEAYNLYIAKAAKPGTAPNVYLSISSRTLWLDGIETALGWIAEDLKAIGKGKILFVQVSRVDLCADFLIPGGLSHEFLLFHKATRTDKGNLYLDRDMLETFYVGDAKSPIQLRIYNKGLEVRKRGTKGWFLDLWAVDSTEDIWRVEFQIRRPALKGLGINSLDDLKERQKGLWKRLTSKWFSLRLPDNEKVERRTVHPLWCAVQECFPHAAAEIQPVSAGTKEISPEWHLSHIDGCLSSFAALLGITSRDEAINELKARLERRNNAEAFEKACVKKAIQKGTLSGGGGR